jgi:DUF971 family protein
MLNDLRGLNHPGHYHAPLVGYSRIEFRRPSQAAPKCIRADGARIGAPTSRGCADGRWRISTADAGGRDVSAPDDIAIERDSAVIVTWDDGHQSRLPLVRLRERCPCARCDALRRTGDPVWSGKPRRLRVAGAELVGGWGLGLAWSDGHATGVYAWSLLRSLCPCPDCDDG